MNSQDSIPFKLEADDPPEAPVSEAHPPQGSPKLPVGYYLDNFESILSLVLQRDTSLFTEEEYAILASFSLLPLDQRRLYVRLLGRSGPWIRRSSLRYPEIFNPEPALQGLAESGWLRLWQGEAEEAEGVLQTVSGEECGRLLRRMGHHLRANAPRLRRELLQILREQRGPRTRDLFSQSEAPGSLEVLLELDGWISVQHKALVALLPPLYFGNRHQDLGTLTAEALGILNCEQVQVEEGASFRSREELESVLRWGEWRDTLLEQIESFRPVLRGWRAGQKLDAVENRLRRRELKQTILQIETLAVDGQNALDELDQVRHSENWDLLPEITRKRQVRNLQSIVYHCAEILERVGSTAQAIELYRGLLRLDPLPRYARRAIDRLVQALIKGGRKNEALSCITKYLQQPIDEILRHRLLQRQKRLNRDTTDSVDVDLRRVPERTLDACLRPGHSGGRVLFTGSTGAALTVEELVLEHWQQRGWIGAHVENSLLRSLAGLICWDLIFQALPGAFLHKHQCAPLDWGDRWFYDNRRTSIRRRLAEVEADQHRERALQILSDKEGLLNPLINWSMLEGPRRDAVIAALWLWPGACLAPLLDRLLQNTSIMGHGLPDLFLWDPRQLARAVSGVGLEEKETPGHLLIEVKGPGDTCSIEQILWHETLLESGLPVELWHVSNTPKPSRHAQYSTSD